MSDNAFGWLLILVFVVGVWATLRFLVPRLNDLGLWIALAAASTALVLAMGALVRLK